MKKQTNKAGQDNMDLQALKESEARFRSIVLWSPDAIIVTDAEGKIEYMNPAAEGVFDRKLESFIGKDFGLPLVDGESTEIDIFRPGKDPGAGDMHVVETEWLNKKAHLITIRDISERKRAEEALRESEERYRVQFEQTIDALFLADTQTGIILECNRAAMELIGREKSEMVGQHQRILHPSEERDGRFSKSFKQHITGETLVETKIIKKSGEIRDVAVRASTFDLKGKKVILAIFRDITERKKSEEALLRAAQEWRTTFDSITDLVSLIDREFRLVRVNKAFAHAFGMEPKEVVGKTCYELVRGTGESWFSCPHKKTVETGKPNIVEFFEPRLKIYLEVSTSPIFDDKGEVVATVHTAKDITQRKEIEKSQRLSQLGKLVADMAHEVNNPLMIISGNAQLSLMEGVRDEEVKKNLKIIFEECKRAKDIIQRLLKFSRPSRGEIKEVDINKSIEAVVSIVEHQFKLINVEIKRNYLKDPPLISIDEQQMQEVFMNLINNASEAMPGGGAITITTSLEGDFFRIDLKDTGCGMSEEVKKKLFEPFFTTKEKGTGLGLAVCYGIIKAHNGELKFESELNKGATATVLLPLREGGVERSV